ncbi:glycosyltransferase [Candidatus Woesearchaeota archaeon]|nr:glycosyltransferase [Candidatus Woesearchaeota archaeon]
MTLLLETTFWTLIALIIYNLIGYPLILFVVTLFYKNKTNAKDVPQKVSLIIPAYNEEKEIEKKIIDSLKLNYPNLEIIIVSDGSTDNTNKICRKYKDKIRFIEINKRGGKINALNHAVKHTKGNILFFSDANIFYDENAIRQIVKHFNDKKVGCVTAYKRVVAKKGKHKQGESIYNRMERFVRKRESLLSSVIHVDGAMYAMRKKLYQPLHNVYIEDFIMGMNVIKQGYRVIYETNAKNWEKSSPAIKDEFERKSRMVAGGLQSLKYTGFLIKRPLILWQFVSHRLIRWVTAELLIAIFILNLFLLDTLFYRATLDIQLIVYILAILGSKIKLLSVFYYFLIMQASVLNGLIRLLFKTQKVTWNKAKRV